MSSTQHQRNLVAELHAGVTLSEFIDLARGKLDLTHGERSVSFPVNRGGMAYRATATELTVTDGYAKGAAERTIIFVEMIWDAPLARGGSCTSIPLRTGADAARFIHQHMDGWIS
ncbi:hypothetical protein EBR66_06835 [bacterium]|nr:hypothetical protein [bacterium]